MKTYYRLFAGPEDGCISIFRGYDTIATFDFEHAEDRDWCLQRALDTFYELMKADGLLEDCPPV